MADVFVSYAASDKAAALRIVAYLEGRGIRCWVAPRDVPPGADYAHSIMEAIREVSALVLVLSEQANLSQFVRREVERAVSLNLPVLPVRIREVLPAGALEFYVSSAQWVDAWTPPMERHLAPLIAAIRVLQSSGAREGGTEAERPPPPPVGGSRYSVPLRAAMAGLLVLAALGAGLWWGRASQPLPGVPDATVAVGTVQDAAPAGSPELRGEAPGVSAVDTLGQDVSAPRASEDPGTPVPAGTGGSTTPPVQAGPAPSVRDESPSAPPHAAGVDFFAGTWCQWYNGTTIVFEVMRTGPESIVTRVDHPNAFPWDMPERIVVLADGFETWPLDQPRTDSNFARFRVVDEERLSLVFAEGAPEDGSLVRFRCAGRRD